MATSEAAGDLAGHDQLEARVGSGLVRLAWSPRWGLRDPGALGLIVLCVLVVAGLVLEFQQQSASADTLGEAAHVVLLALLAIAGMRMHLTAGLALAASCEAVLAVTRIAYTSEPALLALIWAVLGPGIVAAVWALSEYPRMIGRAEARAAIVALGQAIATSHEGTGEHSDDVADLALAVGRRMGLDRPEMEDLELAALLHDVGKIGIPREILDKPGPLDPDEMALIRRHPRMGADLVRKVRPLAPIAPALSAMHERWDGGGYPAGLAGQDIPRISRIVFACDAFSAMCQERPYARARDPQDACAELVRSSGTQLDPEVVQVLVEVLAARSA